MHPKRPWFILLFALTVTMLTACRQATPPPSPPLPTTPQPSQTAPPPTPSLTPRLNPSPSPTLAPTIAPLPAPQTLQALRPAVTLRFSAEGHLAASVSLGSGGQLLALGYGDGRVYLFDRHADQLYTVLTPPVAVDLLPLVRLTPDGAWLLAVGPATAIPAGPTKPVAYRWQVANLPEGQPIESTLPGEQVNGLALHPTLPLWVAGTSVGLGEGGHIGLWPLNDHAPLWVLDTEDWITGLTFHPDGEQIAAVTYGRVLFYRTADGKRLNDIPVADEPFWTIAYASDGKTLLLASNALLYALDPATQTVRYGIPFQEPLLNPSLSVRPVPARPLFAIAQSDGIHWHTLEEGTPYAVTPIRMLPAGIGFDPTGHWLAVAYPDGQVDLYALP